MDYNKEVIAGKAKAEVKDLVENYPKYAKEILGIVAEYDKDFTWLSLVCMVAWVSNMLYHAKEVAWCITNLWIQD